MSETTVDESWLHDLTRGLERLGTRGPHVGALLAEVWSARKGEPGGLAGAGPLAVRFVEEGVRVSEAVRLVLSAGRLLVESAVSSGRLGAGEVALLEARIEHAAIDLAEALEVEQHRRRQAFLSFLVHEIKNPLNTIVNALWLLKEKGADAPQAGRFLELADRALKRLEGRVKDVRELDEDLVRAPPGWQGMPGARRPEAPAGASPDEPR